MTTAPLRAICRRARSPKSKSDRHLHPAVHARIDNGPSRDRRCDPQVLPRDRPTALVAHGLGVPRDVTCRLSLIGGRRRELVAQGSALLEPIGSTHHQVGNQRFDVFDSGRPDPVFMTHDRSRVGRTTLVGWGVLRRPRFLPSHRRWPSRYRSSAQFDVTERALSPNTPSDQVHGRPGPNDGMATPPFGLETSASHRPCPDKQSQRLSVADET